MLCLTMQLLPRGREVICEHSFLTMHGGYLDFNERHLVYGTRD